ncbi:MAG: FAD-dependent monooxygenase [Actinomycetota bacterium]|nr:FAD-dependent monooxygenase [Actinomycetota bacterium]
MNGPVEERVQVLVVGAGPAGLATALELAARGLAPLILECRPACGSHPRAIALTAETMQLLSRWGAEPDVRRLGFRCEYAMSIRSCLTGPEIQRVPLDGHVWACAQDHLETILAQRAAAAGARLRYGAELTGLHPAGQEMLATVAAAPGPPATIRARYVVGADGAHSMVREAAGITTSRARAFGDWISILFRSPLRDYTGDPPCLVYGIGDPSTGGVIVPADPVDRWIRGIPWHRRQGEHLEDFDQQRCTALIRSAAGVPDLPVQITDIRAFTMTAAIADHYRAGRAVLAGDAAHVFTPATGMGLNLALHDATVLAQALASAIGHGDQPRRLDQYEQACRPLAEKLLEPELAPA